MSANVRSWEVGSGSGTTLHVDRPSPAPVQGDQLWAVWTGDAEGDDLGAVVASGFSTVAEYAPPGSPPIKVLRKTASVAEPGGGYTFGQPPATTGSVHLICVRDASPTVAARVATLSAFDTGSLTPTVTPAAGSHLEIRFACFASGFVGTVWGEPSGYTMRGTVGTGNTEAACATRAIASSAPSGVKTFTRGPGVISVTSSGITISIPTADIEPETPPIPPFTPAAGTADFTYPFRRMLGDRAYLGHLDLTGVSFERRASAPGTFSASVPITSEKIADQIDAIIPRDRTQLNRGPGVIVCEIQHKDEYWGEAWITGYTLRKDPRKGPVLQLRGVTLEGYLQHVRIRDDIDFTGSQAADQFEILRQLLTSMQSRPHADLGLVLPVGDSGQVRERFYKGSERAPYGQRITELGDVLDGFEWTIDTVTGAGLERHVRVGSPTIGDPDAVHVFGQGSGGGDIDSWGYEVDALRGGTVWEARGDTPDTGGDASVAAEPLFSGLYEASAHLAAGQPAIERLIDRPGVKLQETLEEYAAGWAARKSGAVTVFSVTVVIGENPSFTPNNLGDTARFVMSDEWHKRVGMGAGLDARHRVIGLRLLPAGRGQGKGLMELILESSEVT